MQDDDFFVEVQHRPRRVAFLLTVDGCPDALLDEIVDFNVSSWGGRYNPVIPVTDGQITEPYWKLLNTTCPQIFDNGKRNFALVSALQRMPNLRRSSTARGRGPSLSYSALFPC